MALTLIFAQRVRPHPARRATVVSIVRPFPHKAALPLVAAVVHARWTSRGARRRLDGGPYGNELSLDLTPQDGWAVSRSEGTDSGRRDLHRCDSTTLPTRPLMSTLGICWPGQRDWPQS